MPIGQYVLTAHAIGDKIYTFGGYGEVGYENAVQEYDPAADSWAPREPVPTKRYIFTSQVVGGKAYVIGGHGPQAESTDWSYKDSVEIFDPNGGWSSGTPMPRPVAGGASCALGERIFVFGGEINNFTSIYDVNAGTWSRGAPPLVDRNGHACVRSGESFFLVGGRSLQGDGISVVEKYDPTTDTWQRYAPVIPQQRHWFGAVALDRNLYVFGGISPDNVPNSSLLDSVDVLDLAL